MLVSSIARFNSIINAYNAAFNVMQSKNALLNLTNFAGQDTNPQMMFEAEKALNANILQNSLMYRIATTQSEDAKKRQDEDIKRSFSIFG